MKLVRLLIAIAVAMTVDAPPLLAQVDQGRIAGTVRDQSGAFAAGVPVKIKNERTGEERSATTNDKGYFLVTGLKPSTYTIVASRDGFTPVTYDQMPLAVGQELTLDFELKPAGVQEAITVVGASPVIDLSSAKIGVNLGEREVNNLPVNGRQMSQLMLQAPGSQNAGTGTWQDIRFSGRAVEQNAIRYDGIEGSAIIDAAPGNLNGEVATPFKLQASLENIQEFRVESSAYPAEFGTGSGGQVSVITKSGSNAFHGAGFEYIRNDALDAPNYFDTAAGLPKSLLEQNQFGGSIGGPIAKNRAFFFGSYEGYRLKAGINIVEAVPSDAAWARAVPTVAGLRPGFLAPGAVILAGKSTNPDFDIAQIQTQQEVNEDSFSGRLDLKLGNRWSSYVRVFADRGVSDQPNNVAGQVIHTTAKPRNAVFNLQGILSDRTTNEFKFGYNGAPTSLVGVAPVVNGIDFSTFILNLSGSVANTGIAGQGASSGITVPGGLIRANSAQNGRSQPYDPYTLSLIDSISSVRGSHFVKTGGEVRLIRMSTDRLGGTTYSFTNLNAFLANQPSTIQYLGDESAPSVFNNGATGERNLRQEYYIAYAQDEWHVNPRFTLNYGVRYDYYTPMREANNLIVKFNIDTGVIDPNTTRLFKSTKTNLQPRVGATFAATERTVLRGGFGLFVGPGQTEDQIQPAADSDRISTTLTTGTLAFPLDPNVAVANFTGNPNNRNYQPRAFANDYEIPERIWQYTASLQQDLGHNLAFTAAYVGAQGRNLFLRSVANQITQVVTNPNPANGAFVIRQFSIVQRDAAGTITGVQNPFAEIDYKTSGGTDNYNAMQLGLSRRSASGLSVNAQYTLSRSFGNTSGSNEALTVANNARTIDQFDYDLGYNSFDVRHTFNLSALYAIPYGRGRQHAATGVADAVLGGWDIGGIVNARSGLPIDVRITRPDIVYIDAAGTVFNNPAAGRTAVINTPGGGNSRNVRRPNLVPGANPYVESGGVLFLNPAAFSTPAPGTFGDLERGLLHGPNFRQFDLVVSKHFPIGGVRNFEFRAEFFNLFNASNFSNPVATLPNALPTNATTEANKVQPGQPYTAAAAGTFGTITSTVGRTVGLGTSRQIQFALRLNF
ncbi:MAG TPA: TonB-dependent receptor [Vicinamibacterales bacterium]|nr:TonB-dependent receptor [Vicinamibacterales bacterium]